MMLVAFVLRCGSLPHRLVRARHARRFAAAGMHHLRSRAPRAIARAAAAAHAGCRYVPIVIGVMGGVTVPNLAAPPEPPPLIRAEAAPAPAPVTVIPGPELPLPGAADIGETWITALSGDTGLIPYADASKRSPIGFSSAPPEPVPEASGILLFLPALAILMMLIATRRTDHAA